MLLSLTFLLLCLSLKTATATATVSNSPDRQEIIGPLLSIFSSLDEGTITKIPSPDVIFDIENPSSYRRKPSWYMRFRHRNK